ncbi:MAG: hypothetical protein CL916_04180 [Deltaproteobacteria bacterium]|nr:hypothetical protein [Deltaproteobacteria bacterium]
MLSVLFLISGCIFGATDPYSVAYGERKQNREKLSNAITWNPLAAAIIEIALGDLKKEGSLIDAGASDFNLRFQRRINSKIGFTIQADYTQFSLFTRMTYIGIRGGPRLFFHPTNLKGWSATPFVTLGRNSITAGTYSLSSWFMCGAGSEINYTWFWGSLLMEVGLGGYFTQNLGYRIHAESMQATTAPAPLNTWKPLITMGLGYAF